MGPPVRIALLCLLLSAFELTAGDLVFEWDPSPDPSVTGYVLYVGTNADLVTTNAVLTIGSSSTNCFWTNATVGVDLWAFVVCTNQWLPSDPSNRLKFRLPGPPANLRLRAFLQTAPEPGGPWMDFAQVVDIEVPITPENAFLRMKADLAR